MPPEDLSAFSPLSLDQSLVGYNNSFNATGDLGDTVTTAAPPSNNPSATGANPSAGVSGFQTVLNTLTSVFSSGVNAYNTVARNTGLPLANGTPSTPVTTVATPAPVFLGLTQNQLLMIGGGVALIAVLFLLKRR